MRIGVFDSGIGGLTVLAELMKRFPTADFVYLGDTAHVPYGSKSPRQIRRLASEGALTLKSKKLDALVVACNTASSLALDSMREIVSPGGTIPVHGVVEPGVRAVLDAMGPIEEVENMTAPILILATRATVQSQAYSRALKQILETAPGKLPLPIIEQSCPLLVPMIEEGWVDHPVLHQTIAEYVAPHVAQGPGVALLGCTHYPWIHQAVEKALPGWKVINSAQAIASALASKFPAPVAAGSSSIEWIFTDADAVRPSPGR